MGLGGFGAVSVSKPPFGRLSFSGLLQARTLTAVNHLFPYTSRWPVTRLVSRSGTIARCVEQCRRHGQRLCGKWCRAY
jgi:hypothetical protein